MVSVSFFSFAVTNKIKVEGKKVIHSAPRLEHIWGSGDVAPSFFTSALDRGE
jgi:hypothetical protein